MKDLDYIKSFSKISISRACKNLNINRANVLNGRASKEKIKLVREELENQVFSLYIKNGKQEDNTL